MEKKIILEHRNKIATLFFNNPEGYNSFDLPIITSLASDLVSLAKNNMVKGIIISGKGKAFSTGGDLKWGNSYPGGAGIAFHELSSRFHQAILEIRNMPKPVIAAINGIAAGGGFSLALACDLRIISKTAILKQGYTSSGLTLDGGGSYSLPRLVGLSKAMEIISFDEPITADDALAIGLVNKVVDDDQLYAEANSMMQKITDRSMFSFGRTKRLINASYHNSFETQLESERQGLCECAESNEGKEGMRAFLEKRRPEFSAVYENNYGGNEA